MFIHGIPFLAPWGWVPSIFSILISVLIISIIVRVIIRIVRGDRCRWRHRRFDCCGDSTDASARTILDERYAKGEIDEEEYRRRRDNLK